MAPTLPRILLISSALNAIIHNEGINLKNIKQVEHDWHPVALAPELGAVVGNVLVTHVNTVHDPVVIFNHLWDFYFSFAAAPPSSLGAFPASLALARALSRLADFKIMPRHGLTSIWLGV